MAAGPVPPGSTTTKRNAHGISISEGKRWQRDRLHQDWRKRCIFFLRSSSHFEKMQGRERETVPGKRHPSRDRRVRRAAGPGGRHNTRTGGEGSRPPGGEVLLRPRPPFPPRGGERRRSGVHGIGDRTPLVRPGRPSRGDHRPAGGGERGGGGFPGGAPA